MLTGRFRCHYQALDSRKFFGQCGPAGFAGSFAPRINAVAIACKGLPTLPDFSQKMSELPHESKLFQTWIQRRLPDSLPQTLVEAVTVFGGSLGSVSCSPPYARASYMTRIRPLTRQTVTSCHFLTLKWDRNHSAVKQLSAPLGQLSQDTLPCSRQHVI